MPESDLSPLERVMERLETNRSATPEGYAETMRLLARTLALPVRDYARREELARAFIPPGWECDVLTLAGGFSCFLRKDDELVRGCGPSASWAILFAALWAIDIEEKAGRPWRPVLREAA
jgi:hypothetical protein